MLFVNKTGKRVKIRLGDFYANKCYWKTIDPNEKIELEAHHGKALGFKIVGAKDEVEPDKKKEKATDKEAATIQPEKGKDEAKEPQVKPGEPEEFRRNLLKINGIGRKTVRDILQVYPTEDDLRKAVQDGDEMPIRDDLAELLKKYFEA